MDGSYDEVFAAPGQPRAHASALGARWRSSGRMRSPRPPT